MRLSTTILLAMAASFISACGAIVGPTAQEMTLQAQNNEMSTQIFDLRQTATVEVDRMMITVEHAQTEVSSVQLQRDAMRATSLARGTDPAFFEASIPGGNNLPVGITPEVLIPVDPNDPAVAPPITPAGAPVQPQGQPTQPAPQPTVPLDGPRLSSPTLTTSVGNDDCATASLNTFEAATPEIYIVATAMEFPANTTVTTTWTRDGQVMDSYDFTYDFEIDGACIWSFIDQTDFAFTPGNWAVQLQLSTGGGVGPLPFSITGGEDATMEEDAMMEEGS